jgi:adenylate kinase family enzyme
MKIFVIGKRYSGKTPFCIEVSAASGWQHIEALNWLRSHFESGEFAHMLLDHELMNQITLEELDRDPKQCTHYIERKLEVGRPAIIDGLFAMDDFLKFFNPKTDYVIDIKHTTSRVTATSYERELDDIRKHVHACEEDETLDPSHVFRYRFSEFRRGAKPDKVTKSEKKIQCSSLEAATSHFVGQLKAAGLLARK